jgi:hypothetical protein
MNALCNYGSAENNSHEYKRIREAIYLEHKEKIDADLNQDLLEKISSLEKTIQTLQSLR